MNAHGKPHGQHGDLNLGELLDALGEAGDLPLVFHYDGRPIRSGYHVTEVKAGQFSALDCGANPEAWSEIFVQLLDVEGDGPAHMAVGKFAAIVRKVSGHVKLDTGARLTFEVSDGQAPMQLFSAVALGIRGAAMHVELAARPARCKPRDRWLDQRAGSSPCCAPAPAGQCCG